MRHISGIPRQQLVLFPESLSLHLTPNRGFLSTSLGCEVVFDCVIRG